MASLSSNIAPWRSIHPTIPSFLLPSTSATSTTSLAAAAAAAATAGHHSSRRASQPQQITHQTRHASRIHRPRQPYQFTQLVQLSDGSTYTVRTTSPHAMLRSVKDSRNHSLWQPSDKTLQNIEVDEAGKLAAFRTRFGRGWDLESARAVNAGAKAALEDAVDVEGDGRHKGADGVVSGLEGSVVERQADRIEKSIEQATVEGEDDSFADLMGRYVRDEPSIPKGKLDEKMMAKDERKGGKKGKK